MNKKNDRDIKHAFHIVFEHKMWRVPETTHNELSQDFREKLEEKISKSFYLFNRPVSKIAVLITMIFLTIILAACAILIDDIFVHRGPKNNDIGLNSEIRQETISETFIIDGTLVKRTVESTWIETEYDGYILTQYVGSTGINLDNEDTAEVPCMINDTQGMISEKNDDITIIWGQYGYIFELYSSGKTTKDNLVKIAASLQPE